MNRLREKFNNFGPKNAPSPPHFGHNKFLYKNRLAKTLAKNQKKGNASILRELCYSYDTQMNKQMGSQMGGMDRKTACR